VQNLLSSSLLSKYIKIKIVVLYECETWLLILRVFQNRVLRIIFGAEGQNNRGMKNTM
jgi:hypothetical protein